MVLTQTANKTGLPVQAVEKDLQVAFIAPKNGVCCYNSDEFIILEDYQTLQDYGYTT